MEMTKESIDYIYKNYKEWFNKLCEYNEPNKYFLCYGIPRLHWHNLKNKLYHRTARCVLGDSMYEFKTTNPKEALYYFLKTIFEWNPDIYVDSYIW